MEFVKVKDCFQFRTARFLYKATFKTIDLVTNATDLHVK